MPYHDISKEMTIEEFEDVKALIEELKTAIGDFLVNLTPQERSSRYKIKTDRYVLVQKSLMYAEQNPHLIPPYANLANAKKDFALYNQLVALTAMLTVLLEGIDDTRMAAGSEAIQFSRVFYGSVQFAAQQNVYGTDVIAADLGSHYDLPPRPEDDNETPPEGGE